MISTRGRYAIRVLIDLAEQDSESYIPLKDIAARNGFTVEMVEAGEKDHIHCFLTLPPDITVSNAVRHLKGESAILLFRRFQWLRKSYWSGHLWNPAYFAETIGSTSESNIRRYITAQ